MRLVLLSGLVFAAACAGDGGHDGGDDPVNCATEDRDDEFVAGLEKAGTSGALSFQLMTATPAPPSRGDNTWLLQVTSGGAPVSGATILVTPNMPDHGHGTPISVEVTPEATPGQYKLAPVNMWMPGLWETTIEVVDSPSGTDRVMFSFCIPT